MFSLSSRRALVVVAAATLVLGACSSSDSPVSSEESSASTSSSTAVETQSGETADTAVQGATIIDVRTDYEYSAGHLDGALNIDVTSPNFADEIAKLDPQASYIVYCRSGNRSGQALALMNEKGFENVENGGSLEEAAALTGLSVVE